MSDSKLAILVGGGPAPGINSVIGAATIRACLSGVEVLGVQDGFKWLIEGDTSRVTPLSIADTSRIHFRGGSTLGISRANPTKSPELLAKCLDTLQRLGVGMLVTIGGDDTCFSASQLAKASRGKLRVVHVPKTIDNDLDLPQDVYTFGFQTARHIGVEITKNLMVDAKTTSRWYFVVAMGRKAGHLALGIGKAAGATLSLVSEEFENPVPLKTIVDTLAGSIIKRLSHGRTDGVAVLAEGLVEHVRPSDIEGLEGVERDAHGHIRIAEVDFGNIVKAAVQKQLATMGIKTTIVSKNIGYEVRCADPIPFDMEYTRDLGYCAARYVIEGGSEALISMQRGSFVPVPFAKIMDPVTGRMRVRMVDIESDRYKIARSYMLRLKPEDFEDTVELTRLSQAANMSASDFRARFGYLVEKDARNSMAPFKAAT
ncbi:6-phosphofructokinase [Labilithrix luteola]|uniref:Pyrophosphate--fructose 6-phosphate 1-phosphotransferase n=1 Tax=Labilithrix luteola TaxID=1391654 RepID=A0A0K1PUD7_9BACT|nr:diphosphate--fructose-6-phosphate 1-phosphotransferase [Labilithrix luteola]AKU96724.1 6-phosphofructokinase [Labilithrix luteola]